MNDHSFFAAKYESFTVEPKRPFVFLQWNTKFDSCNQVAIPCFTAKYEMLLLYPKGSNCTQFTLLLRNAKFWKLFPNGQLLFDNEFNVVEFNVVPKWSFVSWPGMQNLKLHSNGNRFPPPTNNKSGTWLICFSVNV